MQALHYTAAGGVVVDEDRVLVLRRPSRNEVRLPKGHVETGETPAAAARREVTEESGYADPAIVADLGTQTVEFTHAGAHVIRDERYFLMSLDRPPGQPPREVKRKKKELQFIPDWLPWNEALAELTFGPEKEWVRRAWLAARAAKTEPWKIRKAEPADLAEMQAIARRVVDRCFRPFLGDSVDVFIDSGESDRQIEINRGRCDVLAKDKAILGFCAYFDDLIHLLMVDVAAQRQGWGARLLAHAEAQLFARDNAALRLETFEGNRQAIDFYLKNGWSIVGTERDPEYDYTKVLLKKKSGTS